MSQASDGSATAGSSIPLAPVFVAPPLESAQGILRTNVIEALHALPSYFQSELHVSGVLATDLVSFNTSLGATIEQQVVSQLNRLRRTWDPGEQYEAHRFERQSQRFPDVILRHANPSDVEQPLIGIELKGWYVLAKEREPSFRYRVNPLVCSEYDLLVVYPWALSEVISGSPVLFDPFVISARFAAEYRNWHWVYAMSGSGERSIVLSSVDRYYPSKSDPIGDMASNDKGGNFGRIARTGLLDEYRTILFGQELSGIPLDAWQRFFRTFTEEDASRRVDRLVQQLEAERSKLGTAFSQIEIQRIRDLIGELSTLLTGG